MNTIANLLLLLGQHADLVEALVNAITAGASKESLKQLLRKAEIEASDQIAREEAGLPPA